MTGLASLADVRRRVEEGAGAGDLLRAASRRREEVNGEGAPLHAFLGTWEDLEHPARPHPGRAPAAPGGSAGPGPALRGVPVAVKDNLCTPGLPTTCGSRMLEGYRSPYAATAVRRLEGAGARIFGTTNMDEFAMGSSTENSAFGPTRNPADRDRVPGGSSGGSAAAVAAGIVPVALGSSTGGSVRQPAALCGVVGVKPTYGRVSRYGLVAFASSLDQVGVLARRVEDAAAVLEVIAGHDPRDATCRDRPVPRAGALDRVELAGRTLGLPREYLGDGLHPGIRRRVEALADRAADAGAEVRPVSLPTTDRAISCYYVLAPAEASSNLARFDGVRFGRRVGADDAGEPRGEDAEGWLRRTRGRGFGDEVKRRITLGTYVLSAGAYEAYYLRAQKLRAAVAADFRRAFRDGGVDALLAPTTPAPAFRLGEKTADPREMYLADVYTVAANLAGLPAVSLPAGEVDGLPVGVQLMCPPWEEEAMLGMAARLRELAGDEAPREAGP